MLDSCRMKKPMLLSLSNWAVLAVAFKILHHQLSPSKWTTPTVSQVKNGILSELQTGRAVTFQKPLSQIKYKKGKVHKILNPQVVIIYIIFYACW